MGKCSQRLAAIRFLKAICRLQDACMPTVGLNLPLPVLLAIAEAEAIGQRTSQKILLADVSRSRTGVRHQLKVLTHQGIIDVRRSPDDRRRADIRLSRKGHELIDALCQGVDALAASYRKDPIGR